jgi:dTMP kinase
MSGKLITFEGIDGCGKSLQLKLTSEWLTNKEIEHITTREPGGTKIGEQIRNILLDANNKEMKFPTEILLYLAARAQHIDEIIFPALRNNKIVLCDRFQDSTFAYQSFGRSMDLETLRMLNAFATANYKPNVTFLFDISLETSYSRLKKTGKQPDRLEGENKDFFEKIRKGFLELAAQNPQRVTIIDAEQSIEEIQKKVQKEITDRLY